MNRKVFLILVILTVSVSAMNNSDIASYQKAIANLPDGDRIALWAEKFLGVPYDPDPLGEYVSKKAIIADGRVDCMYLTFRVAELALSRTPDDAIQMALDKRFHNRGIINDGLVVNYDDRFEYGEDMIDSGKWGREVTAGIGNVVFLKGSRGRDKVKMIPRLNLMERMNEKGKNKPPFRSGDIIFFITSPERRVLDEIVGHIGIIKKEGSAIYLIHASGLKNKGGEVKKVLLYDYLKTMPFPGIRVTRFD